MQDKEAMQAQRSKPMMTDKLSEQELAERKRRLNESLSLIRHELDAPHDWEAGYLAGFVAAKEEATRQPDRLKELEEAVKEAKTEIERAMILSTHGQQWQHISKAHSILIIAQGQTENSSSPDRTMAS